MSKILVLVLFALVVTFCTGQNNGGSTRDYNDMKYIEASLANITAQLATFGGSDNAVSHSLTTVTSLLQLSLLKDILTPNTDTTRNMNGEEALDILKSINETFNSLSNQTTINQESISEVQEQVSAMFSTINNMKKDIKTILQYTVAIANNSNIKDEYSATSLPHSCEEIKSSSPNSVSDYYTIIDSDGHTRHVYCNMGKVCGSDDGWTRVGYLNMSNSEEKCPDGFKLYESNGVRACGKYSSGCVSTILPSDGISYSEVCGKVIGYQYGTPDGSHITSDINSAYIDGISLTHGNPRSHIWSFISGHYEIANNNKCPCGTIDAIAAPSFVGNHYYCEAAAIPPWQAKVYTDDPLWDGKGCGPIERPCCDPPNLPWFHRQLSYTTSDYIELRICANENTANEDIPVSNFEIYVK